MNKEELLNALYGAELNYSTPSKKLENEMVTYDGGYASGRTVALDYAISLVKDLEPTKVELTQKEADAFEEYLKENNGYDSLASILTEYPVVDQKRIARAYLDGYTIEKEPLYQVHFVEGSLFDYLCYDTGAKKFYVGVSGLTVDSQDKFTEKEIKAIDPRYWAFAEKVEEKNE